MCPEYYVGIQSSFIKYDIFASLLLAVNDAEEPVEIALPFTVGMWDTTEPFEIELAKGTNVLHFTREGEVKGVSIKDFKLTPVRGGASEGVKRR